MGGAGNNDTGRAMAAKKGSKTPPAKKAPPKAKPAPASKPAASKKAAAATPAKAPPVSRIVPGVFAGGEIEPGTFHGGEIEPGTFHSMPDTWVDDRPDVNEPLATAIGTEA